MHIVRDSSFDEFAGWYLAREYRKHPLTADDPTTIDDRTTFMFAHHRGKTRPWFTTARWLLASLEQTEFRLLVFLECDWTRREGLVIPGEPNYRILRRVAENARNTNYLANASNPQHRRYYEAIAHCHFRLECDSRIAICSAEANEIQQNPLASYYLLDGVGRGLAYQLFLLEGMPYSPVEAFVAERR